MALIVAVCSGAWAQRIAISTDIANGTVAVDNANPTGSATVTLTVTPATGYYITASDIVVTRTAPVAQAPRRTPDVGQKYNVTAASVDATGKGTYTFSVEDGYGAYVEATFTACSAITPVVSIEGWTFGETANSPSVTGNPGNGSVTYYYKVKDADDATYTTTVPTAANTYTVRAVVAAAGHYLGGTATADFTIAALTTVVVTITGHNNKAAYDGTEHSVSGYDVSISNNLYKESDFTFSGTASAARTDVGKTMMGLAASQFTNTNPNFSSVTFNITDGYQEITSIDEVIVTITGHINTTDYDGTEHSVSGYDVSFSNALYTAADFTFSGTASAARTDAGKTMMGLSASQFTNTSANYGTVTFVVTDGYQEISPITATVTITGHNDVVAYDGTEHSVTGYDVSFSNNLYKETDFTFSGTAEAKRTDEGKTMMGLAAGQFTNTNANFDGVTFNVTDGYMQITAVTDVVVTITGHNNTTDYDGTEHSVSGYDVKISNPLYKESYFTFSGTAEAKRTDAGKTMMGLAASQFANKNVDFTNVTFNVTDGYQTISPITATVTIKGHRDIVVYDGTEHKVSGYDATFSNNVYKETDFTFSGTAEAARTDQGTTEMGLAANQFTNNNTNFSTVTFSVIDGYQTINKKAAALTVTVTPKAYDGNTDAEVSVAVDTHVKGESLTITGLTGTFDNASAGTDKTVTVNSSAAVVTAGENTKLDNYEVVYPTQAKGTITQLTGVVVTITGHNNKAAFDGKEHSVSGYDVSISNNLYKESDFTFSGTASVARTEVGKTMMGLAADQFTNNNANFDGVTFNVTDGYQEITSIDEVIVTITGHINTSDYDGTEHSVSGYDVSFSNALYTEADFTFSGTVEAKRTNAGKTMMGLAVSQFTNTNTNFGNVVFVVTDGYQEISPITATVTITGHNNTVTYDGEEHSVSGYDVSFSNALYTEADFTFSGTAEAKRTDAGKTMMGLNADQYANTNTNFSTVTFSVIDGYQAINKKVPVLTVTVTPKGYDGNTDAEVSVTVDTHVKGESLTITGLTGTFNDASAGIDKTVTLNSSKAVVTAGENTKLENYEVVYPTEAKGTIFDRRHSGILVRRNDTNEQVDNDAFLTVMDDGTLRIDQISIINPDAVNGVARGVSVYIPATLKNYDDKTGATYGVASDIIVTDANVPVTDIYMPETDEMIQVAANAFRLNPTTSTTARIHTTLALLDDYALTPGLQAEYEAGHVVASVHATSQYWTLSCGVDVALPDGVTPIICKLRDNASLAAYAITEPTVQTEEGPQVLLFSNNGLLMKSKTGHYMLTAWPTAAHPSGSAISTEPANSYEGNLLEFILESKHLPYNEGYFVLKDGQFHPVKDNAAMVPAGRAVVHLPKTSPASLAPVLTIYDGTTGIALIDNGELMIDNRAGAWYTLDGRKLDKKPTAKGIYIVNGRKVVIK